MEEAGHSLPSEAYRMEVEDLIEEMKRAPGTQLKRIFHVGSLCIRDGKHFREIS